jgi:FAD:protein FMN transferase
MKLSTLIFSLLFLLACSNHKTVDKYTILKGKTMGSTYEIAYDSSINIQEKIDYILGFYSYLVSTYDSQSIVSKFNNNQSLNSEDSISYNESKHYFVALDSISRHVYKQTNGSFNPGIGALINYWGFGNNKQNPELIDQRIVDSLKNLNYGFLVDFNGKIPQKANANQQVNFNGIAAGHVVDIIAQLFDSVYHFKNYYINISGEIRAKGNNGHDSYWPIKIEKPVLNSQKKIEFCSIPLKNYALATSGNYRNFFFKNGKRYGHSIDPVSGFPARNEMLSATILAPSAAEADAYATAAMVMGLKEAIKLCEQHPELKAFYIFEQDKKITFWASANLSYEITDKP